MDIRCEHKKFGELVDGVLEIKCSSNFCGHNGIVVIHRWAIPGGERLEDHRFRDPIPKEQGRK